MTFRHPIDSYVHRTSILGEHMEMLHLHLDLQHCYANANTVIFCRFYSFWLSFFVRLLVHLFATDLCAQILLKDTLHGKDDPIDIYT